MTCSFERSLFLAILQRSSPNAKNDLLEHDVFWTWKTTCSETQRDFIHNHNNHDNNKERCSAETALGPQSGLDAVVG